MNTKQFVGASIDEVLRDIRAELGDEAVILHTRKVVKGGLGGFFGREMIEVTAADSMEAAEGAVATPTSTIDLVDEEEAPVRPFARQLSGHLADEDVAPPAASAQSAYARAAAPIQPDAPADGPDAPFLESPARPFPSANRERTRAIIEAARTAMRAAEGEAAVPAVPAAGTQIPAPPSFISTGRTDDGRRLSTPTWTRLEDAEAAAAAAAPAAPAQDEDASASSALAAALAAARARAAESAPRPLVFPTPQAEVEPAPAPVVPASAPVAAAPVAPAPIAPVAPAPAPVAPVAASAPQALPSLPELPGLTMPAPAPAPQPAPEAAPAAQVAPPAEQVAAPYQAPTALPEVPGLNPQPAPVVAPAPIVAAPVAPAPVAAPVAPVEVPAEPQFPEVQALRDELAAAGVDPRYLDPFIEGFIRNTLPFVTEGTDLRDALRRALAARMPVPRDWKGRPKGQALAFVGQSGVGKSTVVRKLAWRLHQSGHTVAIISAGHEADAHVASMAERMGVSYTHVADADALASARAGVSEDVDIVLIDTPGCSHQNLQEMEDLGRLLSQARVEEVHLVMPVAVPLADLGDMSRRFRIAGVNRITLTKLDETRVLGNLVNVPLRLAKPVAFLADGTSATANLMPLDPQAVADVLLP